MNETTTDTTIAVGEMEPLWLDSPTILLLTVVIIILVLALLVGQLLKRQPERMIDPALVRTFNRRVRAWLIMYATLGLIVVFCNAYWGRIACVVLFGFVSFWALREFVTMTPTRRADHRALFWTFFIFTPLQYFLVFLGSDFYNAYTIMIPVYASLVIPARIALSDDHKRFLERSAKIQFGLLVCVYALSHAPAILDLRLQQWDPVGRTKVFWEGSRAGLLLYFVLVVQISEMMGYFWDRILGKHAVAPSINASKTWEGFLGGALSTAVMGVLLWFTGVTPFTWYGSAFMSLTIAIMGFSGRMTMSAVKRDRGVADYGTLVQGHAGVLDRIDAMCFAAPIFFHLTRFYLGTGS